MRIPSPITRFTFLLLLMSFPALVYAQAPPIIFQRCYGGDSTDAFNCIRKTSDGGYIAGGQALSTDGDLAGNGGVIGMWVVKLDAMGNIQWEKTYPTTTGYAGSVNYIEQTTDGGYIFTGNNTVKLHNDGTIQWALGEYGTNVHQTRDGGYILASDSLIKLDADGDVSWRRSYDTTLPADEIIYVIYDAMEVATGGYVVTGYYENDLPDWGFIGRLDDSGYMIQAEVPFDDHTGGRRIVRTIDSQFVLVANKANYFIDVKFNDVCSMDWDHEVRHLGYELGDITPTTDGGYMLCGSNSINDNDLWIMKLDPGGDTLWSASLGGSMGDGGMGVVQSGNGNYVMAGHTASNDMDVSGNHGGTDAWLVVIGDNTSVPVVTSSSEINIYPVPANRTVNVSLPNGYEQASLRLMDVYGRSLPVDITKSGLQRTVTMDDLPAGEYMLQIINGASTTNKKIIHY
jgi:Secretion system C-terminal sorting domain